MDVAPPGAQCTQQPVRGDGRSTGGFLYTLDCRGQNGRVQAYNDATAGTGLEFEDTDPRDSSHPANQAPPILFGDDCTTNTQHTDPGADGCEQDHAAVHVQDCSQSAIVPKPSTFPGSGDADDPRHPQDHLVRPVPANPVNTDVNSWTIAGQVNATLEEVGPLPRRTVDAQDRVTSSSNCDATDDEGNDVYGLYEIRAGALARGKNGATWNFQFNTATRGSIPANAVSSGGSGAATDLGVELRGAECQASDCTQSGWFAGSANGEATVITLTKGNVGEDEDQDGNDDGTEFGAAPRWTFYAKVSDTFLNGGWQLPGGTGVYGSEQCTGDTTGVSAGNWDCKASNWYLRSDGSATEEPRPFARVHDAYNLRDVDCLDGRIGDTGVTTSVASMGDDACE